MEYSQFPVSGFYSVNRQYSCRNLGYNSFKGNRLFTRVPPSVIILKPSIFVAMRSPPRQEAGYEAVRIYMKLYPIIQLLFDHRQRF